MPNEIKEFIAKAINDNRIVIFMKGSADFPQCGFSAATVDIFQRLGERFTTVDVLSDPDLRQGIKDYSQWPTIPQVYIDGEFIGGCDITRELYEKGELEKLVKAAA